MPAKIKRGATVYQKCAWVTTATDENSAYEAIVLARSIRRTITIADTVVLISDDLNCSLRKLLAQHFDCILPFNVKKSESKPNLPETEILKMFTCSMEMYNKIVVLNSNNLVLQNCDELFELEGKFYISKVTNTQIHHFVIEPEARIDTQLKNMSSQNLYLSDILIEYFGLSALDTEIQLPKNYTVNTDDLQFGLTEMDNVKILTYDFYFMEKIETLDRFQEEIKNFWTTCWNEILNHQNSSIVLGIKEHGTGLRHKDYYKNSIAIVGQSFRFPKSNSSYEFWQLLKTGQDSVSPFPVERLGNFNLNDSNVCKQSGGFLKCPIDEFDAQFFGINPQEAELMDPQQRLLLEVAWEALENAGINPIFLKDSNTGLFTGIWQVGYEKLVKESQMHNDSPDEVIQNTFSAISASISAILGLNGLNITTATGCSCSLLALHLACESLQRQKIDLALVMGSNLLFESDLMDNEFSKHCKLYSENVDEYHRAEGIALIILKRLPDANKNGDRVIGIIRGSAISSEENSSSEVQRKVNQEIAIRDALKNSGILPNEVEYVEANGTLGGHPVEFEALSSAYAGERDQPLAIGSVKTNIGHCESAAGLAAVIKVILSMKHEIIPCYRQVDTLHANINLESLPTTQQKAWEKNMKRVRIAGISSFGVNRTNVHLLLEEPPNEAEYCPLICNPLESGRTCDILNLSAKTETALDDLVDLYLKYFKENPRVNIEDLTFTANNGRAHFKHRLSVVAGDIPQLTKALKNRSSVRPVIKKPVIAFLFAGQGSQYSGMAKILYRSNIIFRNAFNRCVKAVVSSTGIDLRNVLWKDSSTLNNCIPSQLSIFSVEYGLLTLLFSLGIKPDLVFGHSVGEFAAAVAAGIVDVDDALTLLICRSQLISEMSSGGGMVALFCSVEIGKELITEFEKMNKGMKLDIAVVNSAKQIVIAGKKESIQKFKEFCTAKTINYYSIATEYAFHSREMDSILEEFGTVTSTIEYKPPVCKYVSGMSGCLLEDSEMHDGSYWHRNTRNAVNFPKSMQTAFQNGCNIFIEVGPRPILLTLGMENVSSENLLWLPTLHQVKDNWETLLESLGKLYVNGININWSAIDTPELKKKLELPTYPFQREKYWVNISEKNKKLHPLLGKQLSLASVKENVFANELSLVKFPYLKDHLIANLVIMPGAGFLEIIAAAGKQLLHIDANAINTTALYIQDFVINAAFVLEELKTYPMQVISTSMETKDKLEIGMYIHNDFKVWKKHSGAMVTLFKENGIQFEFFKDNIADIKLRCGVQKTSAEFYTNLEKAGVELGEEYRVLEYIWSADGETLASVRLNSLSETDDYIFQRIILDAMMQTMLSVMKTEGSSVYLVIGIDKCLVYSRNVVNVAFAHAKWNSNKNHGTVALYGEDNNLFAVMIGVRLVKSTFNALLNSIKRQKNTMYIENVDRYLADTQCGLKANLNL